MKITSIERSKRNKDKLMVYIDDEYNFSVSEEDYLTLNLYEKKEITEDEINYIKNSVNFRRAKSTAVRFLSLKLRSEAEVVQKLENEGFDSNTIERVIEELKSLGYINDRLYVQKFIFDRSKLKPKSKKLLKYELINKGIKEEVIDEILSDWKVDESAVAEGLVRKKFGKYNLSDEKIIKKVYSFLQHRGFSYELASRVIKKLNSVNR